MTACQNYLDARKISPETAAAHRLEIDTAPAAERIIERLGEDIQIAGQPLSQIATELLWIPYRNADGGATAAWVVRIFPAPVGGPKFLAAKGSNNAPFIPLGTWAVASKADVPVVVTEGPIKALAIAQAGFPAIGLNGVYGACARDADDKIVLHPLLASFAWPKRSVYLAFDADITTKFEPRKALLRTFLLLAAQQADVYTITSWDLEEGKGIDDFLAKSEKPAEQLELLIKDRAPFLSILEKTPADVRLVEEELKAVALPRLQRAQIVRQLAKGIGVPVKDLLTAISPPEVEPITDRKVHLVDETVPWDAPVDGEELIQGIYKLLGEFMWMSNASKMTIAFWLIASYAFKAFRKFPYLRIKSPDRNCGKSTLVDGLNELVFNPILATDATPAVLYRMTEDFQPTILLDEFDNAEQLKELKQLLNAGHDAGRYALRYNNEKGESEKFRTYCPKVIASIGTLPGTLESRCLPIDMQRVPADAEKLLIEFCDLDEKRFQEFKRKTLAWIQDHWEEIKHARPIRPDWLKTRDWNLWKPLFVVAHLMGERAIKWVKWAATGLFKDRVVEQSLAIEILEHIRRATKQPSLIIQAEKGGKLEPFMRTRVLVDHCNGYEEAPWVNWKSGDTVGLTVERFAKELRQHFKLRSARAWHDEKNIYGYWLKPFENLFNSYLPPDDNPDPPSGGAAVSGQKSAVSDHSENTEEKDFKHPLENGTDHTGADTSQSESEECARWGPVLDHTGSSVPGAVQNATTPGTSITISSSSESSGAVHRVFRGVSENSFLAIDVETSADLQSKTKVSRDALDPHKAELRILSAATPAGNVIVHHFRKGPLPDYLRAAIATTPLIAHGAAFDLAVLQANGYATSRDIFCTLTASRLLTAGLRDSNDLGSVLKRHLGLELPKELGASDFGGLFLTDAQLEYCCNDVIHLHALQRVLQAKLTNPADEYGDGVEGVDLVRVAQLEMALIPLVVDIRLRGIKIDRSRLEQILKAYEARRKQLAAELRRELRAPKLNFSSPEQLLCTLKTLGLELPDSSKETLSAVVDPLAGRILRYRELTGLCTTMRSWLESLDAENRLSPPLNPLGADTGRFSCQKPNLLAVPRNSEVRGCFIPDNPEHVLIEADYGTVEMRIAAWFAREKRMLDVFRNGGDIHGETAERVLRDRQARQSAKPVNFGCLYGGGAERLRITARTEFGIEFAPEQAKQYHEGFFNAYPNLRRWHEAARNFSSELTYGATVFGRRRWADPNDRADHWDWNRFQLATNFEVQGTGADALKIALARLHQQFANGPTRILLPVHDAILIQTPREAAKSVAETVSQTMRGAFLELLGNDFPVAVDTNISERWGEKNS